MGDKKAEDGSHLDIYMDKYELHQNGDVTTYYQGFQSLETQHRYEKINSALKKGYLYKLMEQLTAEKR